MPLIIEILGLQKHNLQLLYETFGAIVHLALNGTYISTKVLRLVCSYDLTVFSENNRIELVSLGVLHQIKQIMVEYSFDAKLQCHCLGALLNLSINGNNILSRDILLKYFFFGFRSEYFADKKTPIS